ncbi:GntR family transcriptional regulator [Actinomyces faecalis]|uniref:GntR family transcriptional regulator n=1 Tax=Actinomyces faecalis TaxID=2722820 RepID=UPI001552FA45|nr:GntR family transcriptional regulator [Actinomyces faecalis]
MNLTITITDSPTPPFEQVRSQIASLIVDGALTEGQRLPPVRQLAGDLRLAPGTVARAYKELEAAGMVVTRRAAGTRVALGLAISPHEQARKELAAAVSRAHAAGMTTAQVRSVVDAALAEATGSSK